MALVCLCYGVNDRRIRREIEQGAETIEAVGMACRAGTNCYGCHDHIDELLEAATAPAPVRGLRPIGLSIA